MNARGESAKAQVLLERVLGTGAPLDVAIAQEVEKLAKQLAALS